MQAFGLRASAAWSCSVEWTVGMCCCRVEDQCRLVVAIADERSVLAGESVRSTDDLRARRMEADPAGGDGNKRCRKDDGHDSERGGNTESELFAERRSLRQNHRRDRAINDTPSTPSHCSPGSRCEAMIGRPMAKATPTTAGM